MSACGDETHREERGQPDRQSVGSGRREADGCERQHGGVRAGALNWQVARHGVRGFAKRQPGQGIEASEALGCIFANDDAAVFLAAVGMSATLLRASPILASRSSSFGIAASSDAASSLKYAHEYTMRWSSQMR